MKVILYMAITANGMIAKKDGNSDWPSSEDFASFNNICRKTGVVIMGRNTFDKFNEIDIPEWPNADDFHIVLTHQSHLDTKHPNIKLAKSPKEALETASHGGKDGVVVCGGSQTFGIFMKENLVDEIYLDIEPLLFGEGMLMFAVGEFETSLEFIESKMLSPQTIQLHYKVTKHD